MGVITKLLFYLFGMLFVYAALVCGYTPIKITIILFLAIFCIIRGYGENKTIMAKGGM